MVQSLNIDTFFTQTTGGFMKTIFKILLSLFIIVFIFKSGIFAQINPHHPEIINDGSVNSSQLINQQDNSLENKFNNKESLVENEIPDNTIHDNSDDWINYSSDDWTEKVNARDNTLNLSDDHRYDQYSTDDIGGEGQDDGSYATGNYYPFEEPE